MNALKLFSAFIVMLVLMGFNSAHGETVFVSRVIDGDTFVDSKGVKYRLLGIDTPETKDPKTPDEPFGLEAYKETVNLIEGKSVIVDSDPKADKADRYGRKLVVVHVGKICVNEFLVISGLAKVERRFPLSADFLSNLNDMEEFAKSKLIGIWSDVVPTTVNMECYESTIVSPKPFLGNNGEIFKLSDGSVWEVKYEYSYLYEYSPDVIACPRQGVVHVAGKKLNATILSRGGDTTAKQANVIESTIISDFKGLKLGNVYKLANGQIWEQTEPWIWIWIWIRPTVMIYNDNGAFKMKVEQIDHSVRVRRIK